MAIILNLYGNYELDEIAKSCNIGLAGITGHYAKQSNWIRYSFNQRHGDVFFVTISKSNSEGIELSGGSPIYNYQFDAQIPFLDTIHTDTISNTNQNPVYNPFLIGKDETSACAMELFCSQNSDTAAPNRSFTVRLVYYTQSPQTGARQTWLYNYNSFHPERSISIPKESQFGEIRIFKLNIWETNYYAIFAGINAAGETSPTNNTMAFLIPVEYFKDKEIKPYVGPVSKESAASAYIGNRDKVDIKPRVLANKNMLGFNSNGVYLCKVSESQYRQVVGQIYRGLSGDILNVAGQVISTVISGNDHRPYEEIQTMLQGVICCHAVPNANRFQTTGTVNMQSICGYKMFDSFQLSTIDRFEQWSVQSGTIPRPSGCFIDYAPYTNVTLSIPILGNLDIDPSAILGKSLALYFTLDAFSGTIACDVCIVEPNGIVWIYTTLQGNCAVSMPLIGAGAETNPLLKIAGGISSLFTGGAQNIPNAVMNLYDGVQGAAYTRPISRVQSSNVMPVISPTNIYLTITTPNNYNAGDFWTLAGVPSHMSGNVGSFSGFTVFEHVDLSGVSGATDAELSEIENTLLGGVWL